MPYGSYNCIYYETMGARCTNKKIKRGLFGIGPRLCIEDPQRIIMIKEKCQYKEKYPRPSTPPPGQGINAES